MVKLLPAETEVFTDKDKGTLQIYWIASAQFIPTKFRIILDRWMIATPAGHFDALGVNFSTAGATITKSNLPYLTGENGKEVTFYSQSRPYALDRLKKNRESAKINFKWSSPFLIPKSLKIVVTLKSLLNSSSSVLEGFDVEQSPIYFLSSRNKSKFHFFKNVDEKFLSYETFSKLATQVQMLPGTIVQSISWPNEVIYWKSLAGLSYVANQIKRLRMADSKVPIRLAVCPYELETKRSIRSDYLVELEAHFQLGISIIMVSPTVLEKELPNDTSLASFGNSLSVDFHGLSSPLMDGKVYVDFNDALSSARQEVLNALIYNSSSWQAYKYKYGISNNDEEYCVRVFNRVREIQTAIECI